MKIKLCTEEIFTRNSSDSANYLKSIYPDIYWREEFGILLLNIRGQIIGSEILFKGGLSSTIVDIRILAKIACEYLCSSVIIFHTHPSGNTSPSNQDVDLTEKLVYAFKLLDIRMSDHLILTEKSFYSFADDHNEFGMYSTAKLISPKLFLAAE